MNTHSTLLIVSLVSILASCAPPDPEPWGDDDDDGAAASNTMPPSGDDGSGLSCLSNETPTQATCGGDECSCAASCSFGSDCTSGCCADGYCAFECVCNGEGSVSFDCEGPSADPAGNGCLDPCDDFACDPGLECLETTEGLKCLLPECAVCFMHEESCSVDAICSESSNASESLCCFGKLWDDTTNSYAPCEENTDEYLDTLCCVYTYSGETGDDGGSGSCCDPFAQECPAGEGCYVSGQEGMDWTCAADVSGVAGAYGDPCEFGNSCDPGLFCLDASYVPDCGGAIGCCTTYCDVTDPNGSAECPGAVGGQECVRFYGEDAAPTDLCFDASVFGICSIPF